MLSGPHEPSANIMSWTVLFPELKLHVVSQLSLDDLNNLSKVHRQARRLLQEHGARLLRNLAERDLPDFFAKLVFTKDNEATFLFTHLDPLPSDPLQRYLKLLKVRSVFNEVEPFYLRALACPTDGPNRRTNLVDAFLILRQMGSLRRQNIDSAYLAYSDLMQATFQRSDLKCALYDAICALVSLVPR